MSDPRYQPGIIAGIVGSRMPGNWPDEIPGIGIAIGAQPLARCSRCPPETHPAIATSNVRYGLEGVVLCKRCAILEAKAASASVSA